MRYKTISRNNDFARVYRRGKNKVHPHVVVYIHKNRVGYTRVGLTCSKKVGNAVVRNRARRVLRHALYAVLPQNVGPYDVVLVARGKTPHLKTQQLVPTLQRLLVQAGLPLPGAAGAP